MKKLFQIEWIVLHVLIASSFFMLNLQPLMMSILLVLQSVFIWRKKREIQKMSWQNPMLWLLGFFVLHLLGLIHTQNVEYGWTNIFLKLPFFIFPIYFLALPQLDWNKLHRFIFYIGVGSAAVCIVVGAYKFIALDENVLLLEDQFSLFMHRGYQALYWSISLLLGGRQIKQLSSPSIKNLYFLGGLILVLAIILSFSKFGMLFLVCLGVLFLFNILFVQKNIKRFFLAISSIVLMLILIDQVSLKPRARIIAMVEDVMNKDEASKQSSNRVRIDMWEASIQVFSKAPVVGVGTGDINDELGGYNASEGKSYLVEHYFNSHNKFLNAAVGFGIIGFLMLCLFYFFLLRHIGWQEPYLLLSVVACILFGLTESSFETQTGVIFQTFLLSFFWRCSIQQANLDKS